MSHSDDAQADNQQEISIDDVVRFVENSYKKIILIGLIGLLAGTVAALIVGQYTATITLNNYSGLDLPRIRYLQQALPKLEQENQQLIKNEDDKFLSSEKFWTKNIRPNILVSKADGKELLDATSLKDAGSKISSIDLIGKATSKELAILKAEKISNFFINGSTFIDLRDLVRGYELKVISIESNLKKKISTAEIEKDYLQKRIKNLNELKGQFPTATASIGQVLDAKDSGAKYLPITTQIIAATTDLNNLKESLARYSDEENQNIVYRKFVEKSKPLINGNENYTNLGMELLNISEQIEKNVTGINQELAIENIKVAISSIQTNKIYGLKQVGIVEIQRPPYIKFIGAGIFGGLFIGFIWALFLAVRNMRKSASE